MNVRNAQEGWARYSTDQLERLLAGLYDERGVPLPSVVADLQAELARRRAADERGGRLVAGSSVEDRRGPLSGPQPGPSGFDERVRSGAL